MVAIPQFLEVNSRRLFCLHYPADASEPLLRVLVIPPFAEELNKCRPLLALTARRLAAAGCEVLMADMYGCGDSEGEFRATEWDAWLDDIAALDVWLARRAPKAAQAYLAVRAGALFLGAARRSLAHFTGAQILLWQPVIDGARFLQQFLRLRVMSDRLSGANISLASLLQTLHSGHSVEIAGYEVNPSLAGTLESARLTASDLATAGNIRIFEFASAASSNVSQPVALLLNDLRQNLLDADAQVITCEQFWATQEVSVPRIVAEYSTASFFPRPVTHDVTN